MTSTSADGSPRRAGGQPIDPAALEAVAREWIETEIEGEPPALTGLRPAYAAHHLERCRRVVELVPVPARRGRMLEVGGGLYLLTFLLRALRDYEVEVTQFWSRQDGDYEATFVNRRTGARSVLPFKHFNAETTAFPYPDGAFDVVVNCELIEHMLFDPVHMLAETHRVLKPGGVMVLTTPNVLRFAHVMRLLRGDNVYDKYCRESPNARHPREYTAEEVRRLVIEVGFRPTYLETLDVSDEVGRWSRLLARAFVGLTSLATTLGGISRNPASRWRGEQIFLTAEKVGSANRSMPEFLYEAPALQKPLIDALCSRRTG